MAAFSSVIDSTLMISSFVLVMMLVVEYLNIITRGWIGERMARSGWAHILAAALLGATPGCLGAFSVVALYSHGAVSIGALTAAMIATSGDEAFLMFAMIPRTALPLTFALLALGVLAGLLTDRVLGPHLKSLRDCCERMEIHAGHEKTFSLAGVPNNFRHLSFARALLLAGVLMVIFGVCTGRLTRHDHGAAQAPLPVAEKMLETGHEGHEHESPSAGEHAFTDFDVMEHAHAHGGGWNWLRVTFLIVALLALFIITVTPEHFLEDHLWRHVVRRHFLALFLWTFGTLLALSFLQRFVHTEYWVNLKPAWLVGSAALLGIIPQSGPHFFFVGAFAAGIVPLSALIVSSIVQDGHGMLPLIAQSRRAFFLVKGINLLVGLVVGGVLLLLGL